MIYLHHYVQLFFFLSWQYSGPWLPKQVLNYLSHAPALFALLVFWIGSQVFVWAGLDLEPPTYTCHIAEMTGMQAQLFLLKWGLANFARADLEPPPS
jgi:hypothetical protein